MSSTPHPDLVRLHALAGSWVGHEKMHPNAHDPKGTTYASRADFALGANGFVVTNTTEQHLDGAQTFSAHGVFWHDGEGQVHLHSWDLFGAPPDVFTGGWEGDRLVLVAHNSMGYWRYGFQLRGDVFDTTMESGNDGETWKLLSEGHYDRS